MAAAIGVGMATIAASLLYVKASSEFKKHYYAAEISAHMLIQPYRQMLLEYAKYPNAVQRVVAGVLVVAAVLVMWGCIRAVRLGQVKVPAAEGALLLLTMMPTFAFVLGRLVTHALEVRHSVGAIVGMATLIAMALSVPVRKTGVFYSVLAALLVGIVVVNAGRVRESAADGRAQLEALKLSEQVKAAVADRRIYFQDVGQWEFASEYETGCGAEVAAGASVLAGGGDEAPRSRYALPDGDSHEALFESANCVVRRAAEDAGGARVCDVPLGVELDG